MANNSISRGFQALKSCHVVSTSRPAVQSLISVSPLSSRSMATHTETSSPSDITRSAHPSTFTDSTTSFQPPSATSVLTTIYSFPTMEPLRFTTYPSTHLHLPLRRDILHRAVIFEGDATRQGTASTKTRHEVSGSHRKIRPQKGTGGARLGTRQSPMLRGGGKVFGPKPRDFATGLPRKMYDLAWRTALSLRYRRGELFVCEDGVDLEWPKTRYARAVFAENEWGNQWGRSLVITSDYRHNLFGGLKHAGEDGRAKVVEDVDVKDLLELGRVIVEKSALDRMLREHRSDLQGQDILKFDDLKI